jgi:hypothetical protein
MLVGAAPPPPREEAGPAALHPGVRLQESEETTPLGAGEKKGRGRRKEEERDRWGRVGREKKGRERRMVYDILDP